MRYLLDANTLSNAVMQKALKRSDVFTLREVVEEYASSDPEIQKITSSGIQIIDISKKHLDKLIEVLSVWGDNLNLIRLFTNEGAADVLILAYVLSERDQPDVLFTDEYTIVTADKELTEVAKSYGIKCATDLA